MSSVSTRMRALGYIKDFSRENGYSPSYREIARELGITSTSTVHSMIKRLISDGQLSGIPGQARSLTAAKTADFSNNELKRMKLRLADGGILYLDCSARSKRAGGVEVSFSGVVDASGLKGRVASVACCTPEEE